MSAFYTSLEAEMSSLRTYEDLNRHQGRCGSLVGGGRRNCFFVCCCGNGKDDGARGSRSRWKSGRGNLSSRGLGTCVSTFRSASCVSVLLMRSLFLLS